MKKKLICLLLSVVMVLLCFAGCAEKTGDEVKAEIGEKASEGAMTLSMYLVSEQPVSADQEKLMEEKVNAITEAEYKIHLDLRYFTPDQYYAVLEEDLAEMQAFYSSGSVNKDIGTPVYVDENGLPVIYYPRIEEFDVDIFYFSGFEKYLQYKDAGYLADLTEELNTGSSKSLKAVINSTLLNTFNTVNGGYFAIPTNRAIGEYTYVLLNKEALKKTNYSAAQITSVTDVDCADMLSLINSDYRNDFVPLYSSEAEIDMLGVKYFGLDENGLFTNEFSVLGGTYNMSWAGGGPNEFPDCKNVFGSADHGNMGGSEQFKTIKSYQFNGYYATDGEEDKPFAVGYVKGGPEVVDMYSDEYEVITVANPMLYHSDLYENMFGISANSNSPLGSAKILTLLNTNEEFRNLLLYGVEGENYVWKDSDYLDNAGNPYKVIERQVKDANKLYVMDAAKTGNVALAYPEMGQHPLASEFVFEQNSDMVVDYVIGFCVYNGIKSGAVSSDAMAAMARINKFSKDIYADLLATETQEEFDIAYNSISIKISNSQDIFALTSSDSATKSMRSYYISWLRGQGILPPTGGID